MQLEYNLDGYIYIVSEEIFFPQTQQATSSHQAAAAAAASKQPAWLTSLPMVEIDFLIRKKDIMCVASLGRFGSHN